MDVEKYHLPNVEGAANRHIFQYIHADQHLDQMTETSSRWYVEVAEDGNVSLSPSHDMNNDSKNKEHEHKEEEDESRKWQPCTLVSWDIPAGNSTLSLKDSPGVLICLTKTIFWMKGCDVPLKGKRGKGLDPHWKGSGFGARVNLFEDSTWDSLTCTFRNCQILLVAAEPG